MDVRLGEGNIYATSCFAEISASHSSGLAVSSSSCITLFTMQREVSRVKQARLLSQNQIREIVMDSHSNEEKYYASEDSEDDGPRPPSRRSSKSQPPSLDLSTSSSEEEDGVGNVPGQQPQPCL